MMKFDTMTDEEEEKDKVGQLGHNLKYEITTEPIEENPRGSKVKSLMLSAIRFSRVSREPTMIS